MLPPDPMSSADGRLALGAEEEERSEPTEKGWQDEPTECVVSGGTDCSPLWGRKPTYAVASVFCTGFQDRVMVLLNDGGLWNRSLEEKQKQTYVPATSI